MKKLIEYIKETSAINCYVMCGVPGSGKSTWIKNNLPENIDIISRDIIRAELGYAKNADDKKRLTNEQEKEVTDREYAKIKEQIYKARDFVIDDINTGRYRGKLLELLYGLGCTVIGVNVKTSLENCKKRRDGQIPDSVIENIYNNCQYIKKNEVDKLIEVEN